MIGSRRRTGRGGRLPATRRVRALAIWLLAIGLVGLPVAVAPTALAGGTSVTDGTRTLTATQSQGLDPKGTSVTVSGRGYDVTKGIYVAVCVDHGPGATPTPCLGGVDMSGSSGGSVWISSNPPPYGKGLATPYGPGGTFSVSLAVVAVDPVNGTDCRVTACAIITRNDHLRSTDRSQDLRIPISFASAPTSSKPPATSSSKPVTSSKPPAPTTKPPTMTSRPPATTASLPATASARSTSTAPATTAAPPAASSAVPGASTATSTTPPTSLTAPTAITASQPATTEAPTSDSPAASTTGSSPGALISAATGAADAGGAAAGTALGSTPPASTQSPQVEPAANTIPSGDDAGFPGLLVALIVVAAAVLAAAGFLFYRRKHR